MELEFHKAKLIKRYKRFLADVEFENGDIKTVHCPNTGAMTSCGEPGDTVVLSLSPNLTRKYPYTWEFTENKSGLIGINTHKPNQIVYNALSMQEVPELKDYDILQKEVSILDSRLDFKLSDSNEEKKPCWVEVKNVTLLENDHLYFPDTVSKRAIKHLETLTKLAQQGDRAVIFYFINRPEGEDFRPATHIDPLYTEALKDAMANGVEALAYRAQASLEEFCLGQSVPLTL